MFLHGGTDEINAVSSSEQTAASTDDSRVGTFLRKNILEFCCNLVCPVALSVFLLAEVLAKSLDFSC